MLLLSRFLSRRLLTSILAFRRVQKQRKQSGKMDGLTLLVALFVGLRTWSSERAKERREGEMQRTTLDEVLSGRV